jgi:hypothetical protein
MAYYIFLKSLTSLEEFRKNLHVKIPPKSPCANFQSLGIFKNRILFRKEFSPSLSAQSFFYRPIFPPLLHWASASQPAQATARPNQPPSSSSHTDIGRTRCCRRPASRRLHGRPDASSGRKETAASIPIISPITRRHFPSSITGNRRLQRRPLKLLQRRSLKTLGLASAL